MKKILTNIIAFLLIGIFASHLTSCKKETADAAIQLSYQMIEDKTWYLDFSITGTSKRTL